MNFLQISLTNKCNLSCWHCPIKDYRNTMPKYPIKNSELIPWIEEYFCPNDWIIELTGGEPALYDGIEELCKWLSEHRYNVLIKTNGLLPINSYKNIKRVAAFHQLNNPPKYFDEMLIIDKIDREAKEEYCKAHNIKYHVIGYNSEHTLDIPHKFRYMTVVNAAGHNIQCFRYNPVEHDIGTDDLNRINHRRPFIRDCCPTCKSAIDAWRFIDGFTY